MFNNQDLACFEVHQEDYKIQLWGKNDYFPKEFLLHELNMTFPNRGEAEDFAYKLRTHFDYPTDWCWVKVVKV